MKKEFLNSLKQPQNLSIIITVLILLCLVVLRIIPGIEISDGIAISAILLALSTIAAYLIIAHIAVLKFDSVLTNLKGRINHPCAGEVFSLFNSVEKELKVRFRESEEIWFLTRTAQGWLRNYKEELKNLFDKNNIQLIVVDPDNKCACEMVASSSVDEWDTQPNINEWCTKYKNFLNWLKNNTGQHPLNLKIIDYLPAYTLIFINPNHCNKEPVIYVELAKYISGSNDRPVFRVTPQDNLLYNVFIEEYKKIRRKAKSY